MESLTVCEGSEAGKNLKNVRQGYEMSVPDTFLGLCRVGVVGKVGVLAGIVSARRKNIANQNDQ